MAHVKKQGKKLLSGLKKLAEETEVLEAKGIHGAGLLISCPLGHSYNSRANQLVSLALNRGLLIMATESNAIRLTPSLLLNNQDLEDGLIRLQHALNDMKHQSS